MQVASSALFTLVFHRDRWVSAQIVSKGEVTCDVGRPRLKEIELYYANAGFIGQGAIATAGYP